MLNGKMKKVKKTITRYNYKKKTGKRVNVKTHDRTYNKKSEEYITKNNDYEYNLIQLQYGEVKREFGKKVADNTNYGWSVEGGNKNIEVVSKLPNGWVITSIYYKGKPNHSFESEEELEDF